MLWIIVLVHRFPDLVQLFPQKLVIAGNCGGSLDGAVNDPRLHWLRMVGGKLHVPIGVCWFTINFSHDLLVFIHGKTDVRERQWHPSLSLPPSWTWSFHAVCWGVQVVTVLYLFSPPRGRRPHTASIHSKRCPHQHQLWLSLPNQLWKNEQRRWIRAPQNLALYFVECSIQNSFR